MRKTLFKLHSYFALIALIPLMIVSLTGSILVFKTEIDQWLMPEVAALSYHNSGSAFVRQDHNILQHTVEHQHQGYIIGAWEIFTDGKEADRVYVIKKNTSDWYKIYFDPFSNKVLSEPVLLSSYLTDWLLNLHYTFMLNGIGTEDSQWGTFIGLLAAIILSFLGVSGLLIHRKFWLQLFKLRLNKSLRVVSGDFHRLIGAWSSPIVLILGITGIYFNAMAYYHEVFEHGEEEHYQPKTALYADSIDFQYLLDDSQTQLEGFTPTYILYPYEPEVNITLFGHQPGANIFASNYSSTVTYDRSSGNVLAAIDCRKASAATQIFDSFRELHFGSFSGLASKLIWCVFGLAPFLLSITGLTIWITRKTKSRRRRFENSLEQKPPAASSA